VKRALLLHTFWSRPRRASGGSHAGRGRGHGTEGAGGVSALLRPPPLTYVRHMSGHGQKPFFVVPVFVLLLAVVGCGTAKQSNQPVSRTYTRSDFQFTINYDGRFAHSEAILFSAYDVAPKTPSGWVGVFLGNPLASLALVPSKVLEVGFWDRLSPPDGLLVVATRPERRVAVNDLASLMTDALDGLPATPPSAVLTKRPKVADVVISGLTGATIGPFSHHGVTDEWVFLEDGKYIYMLDLRALDGRWPALLPLLDAALHSFRSVA
jgi:hypothetical protein